MSIPLTPSPSTTAEARVHGFFWRLSHTAPCEQVLCRPTGHIYRGLLATMHVPAATSQHSARTGADSHAQVTPAAHQLDYPLCCAPVLLIHLSAPAPRKAQVLQPATARGAAHCPVLCKPAAQEASQASGYQAAASAESRQLLMLVNKLMNELVHCMQRLLAAPQLKAAQGLQVNGVEAGLIRPPFMGATTASGSLTSVMLMLCTLETGASASKL